MGASGDALARASPASAFAFALAAGATHALTGPDHVAGVLAVTASARRFARASACANDEESSSSSSSSDARWALARACARQGARWGCGHAFGLAALGGVLLACERAVDDDALGTASDYAVGACMMVLGAATLRSARRFEKRRRATKAHVLSAEARDEDEAHEGGVDDDGAGLSPVRVLAGSAAHAEAHAYGVAHEHARKGEDEEMCERADGRAGVVETVSERKSLWSRVKSALGEESTREGKLAAYAVGVVHGASGVSGVIYILPAVFLDDATRIALYLFGFCLTSVLVMTALAFILGAAPGSERAALRISVAAGASSLIVGVIWIALAATGNLNI